MPGSLRSNRWDRPFLASSSAGHILPAVARAELSDGGYLAGVAPAPHRRAGLVLALIGAAFFSHFKDDAVTPAVFPRDLRRWRGALFPLLAALSLPAAAQSMRCGTFIDADSGVVLRVDSAVQGQRQPPGEAAEPYHLQRDGDQLLAANLADRSITTLLISDDGRYLNDDTDHYAIDSEVNCQTAPTFPADSCRADVAACLGQMSWAGEERYGQWCREGIPAACNRLINNYKFMARAEWAWAKAMADESTPSSIPTVCLEDDAAFDAEACRLADNAERVQAVGKAFELAKDMPSEPTLPDAQLDEVATLCRQQPSATFCTAVASALRAAGRLTAAREALQLACNPGNDPQACTQLATEGNRSPN